MQPTVHGGIIPSFDRQGHIIPFNFRGIAVVKRRVDVFPEFCCGTRGVARYQSA